MLFIAGLFALGTLWFWLTLIAISIVIIAFDYNGREGNAFFTLVLFAVGVIWFNPNIAAAVRANPLWLGVGVLAYLALGVVTAFSKWYVFLLDVRDYLRETPLGTRHTRNPKYAYGNNGEPEYIDVPNDEIRVRGRSVAYPIKVSKFKARIIGWMTYWPWVALWTLLDEVFHRLFHRIYVACAGRLQAMADRITTVRA